MVVHGVAVDTEQMNNYNILATVDVTLYNSINDLYEVLLSLKKEVFTDDERIVIVYNSSSQRKLVDELLLTIDIPEFFVIFKLTDSQGGIDFNFSDSFCIYPWINLRISTAGDVSPCCLFQKTFTNLNQTTIKDAYQSNFMQELRQDFLNGEYPSPCSICWKEEAIGKSSMRQRGKYKFREIYYKLDYQKENVNNLKSVDLSLGNSCNLSCKICNRQSSSTIANQEYANGIISTVEFDLLKQSVQWADSEIFWDQMLEVVQNIKYLDLYGGEPLLSKPHFKFLKKLIKLDIAKNIKIDYNSNGTIYFEKMFDLWQHFKEVKISFSIDDIGSRFETQRYGAQWSQVVDNIQKYNNRKSPTFTTEVFPTINTQNVFYLPELLEWIASQNFDHVAFNILNYPLQYNVTSLTTADKLATIEKLKYHPSDICKIIVSLLEDSIKTIDKTT